ncbi:MAG: hypothetical protein K8R46_10160, partial [Pirellulales bacterium]|nr:hypothetical protein [Pirellulales bacterium]
MSNANTPKNVAARAAEVDSRRDDPTAFGQECSGAMMGVSRNTPDGGDGAATGGSSHDGDGGSTGGDGGATASR